MTQFEGVDEGEIITVARNHTTEFLTNLTNNQSGNLITKTLRQWSDANTAKKRNQRKLEEDISLMGYIRKNCFMKFLSSYTTDSSEIIEIVNELDIYHLEIELTSMRVFTSLLANKIKEQEDFTRCIVEASPSILYLYDLSEDRFLYINSQVKDVLGYEPEEILALGSAAKSYLHPEDSQKAVDNHQKHKYHVSSPSIYQLEGRIKNKKNEWIWLLTREIVYKRNEEGKPLQVIGSALDITSRKKMEESLLNKTVQLQQSNASLEEYAHIASHDLQEPLRKIATFGDRLKTTQSGRLGEDGHLYLNKIISSSQRMQQLISDILSISVISSNKKFERYSLQQILDDALQTLDNKIEKTNAFIKYDPLPEAMIIPSQFRQLFINIIGNSLKFIQPNARPYISISYNYLSPADKEKYSVETAKNVLALTFTDNGIGFDKAYAEKIFEIFQRLHGKAAYEGTGVGLAICRKIVHHHDGKIIAHPGEKEGAVFTILLPER